MSEYSDGDTCAVSADEWRTARKPHRCDACRGTVRIGDRYHRTFYVFEGKADADIRCERCQRIYEHINDRIREDGGGFSEEYCNPHLNCGHTYEERWEEPPPEWLAALAFWLPGEPLPPLPGKETAI